MKELKERWKTKDGTRLSESIVNAFRKGKPLNSIENIEKIGNKFDLRGLTFVQKPESTKVQSYDKPTNALFFSNCVFDNVDFSHCDFRGTVWKNCTVGQSLFIKSNFKGIHIYACDFSNCTFQECDLSMSYLNFREGSTSGIFDNIIFKECNLNKALFDFPIINKCTFDNCKLTETDFDVSQFYDTKFIGTLDSCFFRGKLRPPAGFISKLFRPKALDSIMNPMNDVDFSMTKLVGVLFTDGIDLSRCKFPEDGNYLVVNNLKSTYSDAIRVIETTWDEDDKTLAIGLINSIYFSPQKQNQPNDLIDVFIMTYEGKREKFGLKLFNLLKEIQK